MPSTFAVWTSALTVALLVSLALSNPVHCTRRCTVSFRNSLLSIMGVSNEATTLRMLAPFHEIVAQSKNNRAAARKITWTCFVLRRFDDCLRRCPYSRTKSMKLAALHHWTVVCDAVKKSNKDFMDFVECERHHIERVKSECLTLEIPPDVSLKSFCRRMLKYKKCYNQVPFHCTANAIQLWKQIDMAISDSFLHVSKLNSNRVKIPEQCDWAITGAPHSAIADDFLERTPTDAPFSTKVTTTMRSASFEEFEEVADVMKNRTLRREDKDNRKQFIEVDVTDSDGDGPPHVDDGEEEERQVILNGTTTTVIRYFENFMQTSESQKLRCGFASAIFGIVLITF